MRGLRLDGEALGLRARMGLAALAGALGALGLAPFHLGLLAILTLGGAAWLCRTAPGAKAGAWTGFAAGTGYFAVSLHWIVEPFLVDIARDGWMAPFGIFFSATGFALFWALAFGVARRIAGGGWRFALAFGAALAGAEVLRSLILTGFPWALIGYIIAGGPIVQGAALAGAFGLTLGVALVAGVLGALGATWRGLAVGVALWALAFGAGSMRPAAPEGGERAAVVRLVQPNAPQRLKWDPEWTGVFFERALRMTAEPGAPDLVVWPETSVPYLIEPGAEVLAYLSRAAGETRLAVGGQHEAGGRYYNSLAVVGPEGDLVETYDKHHLVPFGEYMPFGDFLARFGIRGLAQGAYGYSAGPGLRVLDLGPAGRALPLICYEAIFPEEVGAAADGADWLLQITNDAWFGTFAGPQQHLDIARVRAIEQGMPMLRAANTGISAVITATGEVVQSIPLGETGYLDAALPPRLPETLYGQTGDLPVLGLVVVLLLLPLWRRETA